VDNLERHSQLESINNATRWAQRLVVRAVIGGFDGQFGPSRFLCGGRWFLNSDRLRGQLFGFGFGRVFWNLCDQPEPSGQQHLLARNCHIGDSNVHAGNGNSTYDYQPAFVASL
jgi:hypothetical protein